MAIWCFELWEKSTLIAWVTQTWHQKMSRLSSNFYTSAAHRHVRIWLEENAEIDFSVFSNIWAMKQKLSRFLSIHLNPARDYSMILRVKFTTNNYLIFLAHFPTKIRNCSHDYFRHLIDFDVQLEHCLISFPWRSYFSLINCTLFPKKATQTMSFVVSLRAHSMLLLNNNRESRPD